MVFVGLLVVFHRTFFLLFVEMRESGNLNRGLMNATFVYKADSAKAKLLRSNY